MKSFIVKYELKLILIGLILEIISVLFLPPIKYLFAPKTQWLEPILIELRKGKEIKND